MTVTESTPATRGMPPFPLHRTDRDAAAWRERTRLVLTPIAAPSIVGLFGLGAAAFMLTALWARWYDSPNSALLFAPFVIVFGGLVQLGAAMVAFRARDGIATAVHASWGSLFVALGVVWILAGTGVLAIAVTGATPEIGLWLGVVAVITFIAALGEFPHSPVMALTLVALTAGSGLACAGFVASVSGLVTAAGWVMLAATALCAYTAGALMLDGSFRREVLPVHTTGSARSENGNGAKSRVDVDVIEYPVGMPGAHAGQ
jgi:succinate-acetate transporter protein